MTRYLFRNGRILDIENRALRDGAELLTEGDKIVELSDTAIKAPGATVVDLGGRTLMPGLIDCHVHVYLSEVDVRRLADFPMSRVALEGARLAKAMLERGFTTVRDTGGGDQCGRAQRDAATPTVGQPGQRDGQHGRAEGAHGGRHPRPALPGQLVGRQRPDRQGSPGAQPAEDLTGRQQAERSAAQRRQIGGGNGRGGHEGRA